MKKMLAIVGLGMFSFMSIAGAAEDAKTARVYAAKCASCHGEDGKAQTTKGKEMGLKAFSDPAWKKDATDDKIKKAITDGATGKGPDGKEVKMDAYKDKLKPDQIDALVGYVKSLEAK